jgi:hypothetical protein
VTIAKRPSWRAEDARRSARDLPVAASKVFYCVGLDSRLTVEQAWKNGFLAQNFLRHSGARAMRANPESISPSVAMARWIPGLRLTAHPGMTRESVSQSRQGIRRTPPAPDAYCVAFCK